jgi:Fe-Mn family superoxide dismutase
MTTLLRRTVLAAGATAFAARRVYAQAVEPASAGGPRYPYTLPPLPYEYGANEPHIDTLTMQLHHDKHHAAYVSNLNGAIKDYPQLAALTLPVLLARLNEVPEAVRATVRNNGGGHANHTMFWSVMGGKGGAPQGILAAAIARDFGSLAQLQAAFNKAGAKQFGSGWAMVLVERSGKLSLTAVANQDSPLLSGKLPLFGNDVWEHAYYLKYHNKRPDYLAAWWNVVNWPEISRRYDAAKAGELSV